MSLQNYSISPLSSHRSETANLIGRTNLEAFIWKLAVMMALTYIIWGDQVEIRIGAFSCTIQPLGGRVENVAAADELSIFGGAAHEASELAIQDWAPYHDFVHRFYPVAIAEMRQYGVPASILLAQALILSEAGQAPHVAQTNNYFMQPCTMEDCHLEHELISPANEGETPIHSFQNEWLSFREYCKHLKTLPAVEQLIRTGNDQVMDWAKTLEQLSDKSVSGNANQICRMIQMLKLDRFDHRK